VDMNFITLDCPPRRNGSRSTAAGDPSVAVAKATVTTVCWLPTPIFTSFPSRAWPGDGWRFVEHIRGSEPVFHHKQEDGDRFDQGFRLTVPFLQRIRNPLPTVSG